MEKVFIIRYFNFQTIEWSTLEPFYETREMATTCLYSMFSNFEIDWKPMKNEYDVVEYYSHISGSRLYIKEVQIILEN